MTHSRADRRYWTAEEEAELKRLYTEERLTIAEISSRLGRSLKAIEAKIKYDGLTRVRARSGGRPKQLEPDIDPVVKMRRCKGPCGRMFLSQGVHNQICNPCKDYISGTISGGYDEMALLG